MAAGTEHKKESTLFGSSLFRFLLFEILLSPVAPVGLYAASKAQLYAKVQIFTETARLMLRKCYNFMETRSF